MALESAPLKESWGSRAGSEYVGFVDESFFKFFGPFGHEEGNFVHGVVGLPVGAANELAEDITGLLSEYHALAKAAGLPAAELKFRTFRLLPDAYQFKFVTALRERLTAHSGFVGAFYTSVKGLVMERVRVNLLGSATRVPDDPSDLYETAARELAEERKAARRDSPGESWLLEKLLLAPVSGVTHFAAALRVNMRFVYDPRTVDRAEDAHVAAHTLDLMSRWGRNVDSSLAGVITGFDYSANSNESIGLQLADIAAGLTRQMCLRTPALLRANETRRLITQSSREQHAVYWPMNGRLFKIGRVVRMPKTTERAFLNPTQKRLFALLTPVLASGLLTCITDFGVQRHVMPYEGVFMDGVD